MRREQTPTVAVFGGTAGTARQQEVVQITGAVRLATEKLGKLRLLAFGRNADSAEESLLEKLHDLPVILRVAGVLPENQLERLLSSADVLLFVRGPISTAEAAPSRASLAGCQ